MGGETHRLRHWWQCQPCDKRAYQTRKGARKAIREQHATSGMREYLCPVTGEGWHMGHVLKSIKAGQITSGEIVRRPR